MKINIKEKFIKFGALIKKILERYPITIILIYIITLIYTIFTNTSILDEEWMEKIIAFLTIWTVGTFFTENIFEQKTLKRIITYIITAIISVIFVHCAITLKISNDYLYKICICYNSTLITTSIFYIIKKSQKDISEYILKVSINFVKICFLYTILAAGIAIILYTFNSLILEINSDYVLRIEILFFGFIYITMLINSLIDLDYTVSNFFKKLIKFVLMPLVISAFTIIYLYILKILVLREIPKNQIYRIALGLFIIGGFIWTVMQHFKEEKILYKISLKLPLIFIPFILLQIYSIGIRIFENGLTPARYVCVMLVIFEIFYILLYILKKEKLSTLIIIANIFIIIAVLIPGINMFDMSSNSQVKRLKTYKGEIQYSDQEKETIISAYNYLSNDEKGKDYIEKALKVRDIEFIKKLKNSNSSNYTNNYEYIILDNESEKIDISGYNTICKISASNYEEQKIYNSFKNVNFHNEKGKQVITGNILNEIKTYINEYKNSSNKKNNTLRIQLDENNLIILYDISIKYSKVDELIYNYRISGYLLQK